MTSRNEVRFGRGGKGPLPNSYHQEDARTKDDVYFRNIKIPFEHSRFFCKIVAREFGEGASGKIVAVAGDGIRERDIVLAVEERADGLKVIHLLEKCVHGRSFQESNEGLPRLRCVERVHR